tara:strand:- start:10057 stop:11043 length:987 start_codon:yes stop_codon:yes gene_type:complete
MNTKILFLTAYDINKYGGVQNQIKLISDTLNNLNYESKICSPNSNDFNLGKVINFPFNKSIAPITLFPKKKQLKKAIEWADVIHIHEPFIPLVIWRYRSHKKTIVTHHASLNKFYLFIQEILFLFTSQKVISTSVSNEALKNAYTLSKKSYVINNAIKINPNATFVHSYSLLFIGRREKRKNITLFEKLSKNQMISGLYKFTAITNKKGKNKNINYLININEEKKYTILKNTSYYLALNKSNESFGITLIEAVNNGNLLIASNIDTFKEVMDDTALFFKNNDIKSLEKVINYCSNNNLRHQWSKQFNHIKKYDIDKLINKWISIYMHS